MERAMTAIGHVGLRVYHRDPGGAVVEHDTDMERIYDDGRSRSDHWAADDP